MNEYKLIVTALLDGLTETEFYDRMLVLIKAQIDHDTIVPDLSPTASAEGTKATTLKGYFDLRASLKAQQKSNTSSIRKLIKDMKNDVTSGWCPQVQEAVQGDGDKVKLLALGIKGEDDQESEPEYTVSNSKPTIEDISMKNSLEHTLLIRNNMSGKIGLPYGAKRADVYISYGEGMPVDIKKMTWLGEASRGKFKTKLAGNCIPRVF